MRGKEVNFDELYDVRAFRVVVDELKDCYTVLGIVHNTWCRFRKSLMTIFRGLSPMAISPTHSHVVVEDGRPLEVQNTYAEMHQFAEFGVAAHWRYKKRAASNFAAQEYDEKIAWLRQLLAWKSEVTDAVVEK